MNRASASGKEIQLTKRKERGSSREEGKIPEKATREIDLKPHGEFFFFELAHLYCGEFWAFLHVGPISLGYIAHTYILPYLFFFSFL